jgi:hypothetical protein
MLCIIFGPVLGFDTSAAAMMGIVESLVETTVLTLLSQKYFS